MKLKVFFLGFILFCSQISAYECLDSMVANVNGSVITMSDLNRYEALLKYLNAIPDGTDSKALKKQVLNQLIITRIQLLLAKQYGINVEKSELANVIQQYLGNRNINQETLQNELHAAGLNYKIFYEYMSNELLLSHLQQNVLINKVVVSNADIEGFLHSPQSENKANIEYRLSHILLPIADPPQASEVIKTQERAEKLMKDLKNGADFAQQAIKFSAGQQAIKGGDLGWRNWENLPSIFIPVIGNMQVGDIAGPIRNASGLHIVKLVAKREVNSGVATNKQEDLRKRAIHVLKNRKFNELLEAWLHKTREDAVVEVLLK